MRRPPEHFDADELNVIARALSTYMQHRAAVLAEQGGSFSEMQRSAREINSIGGLMQKVDKEYKNASQPR